MITPLITRAEHDTRKLKDKLSVLYYTDIRNQPERAERLIQECQQMVTLLASHIAEARPEYFTDKF